MRGNGLIVAFLVVVWAAYFVPLVLRRYDEAGKSTAIDKLSPLSRTVARRDRRPNAGQEATMHTAEQRSSRVESARVESARVEYSSRSARIAARRRRNVLYCLIFVTAAVVAAAAFALVPWWAVAFPCALDAAWLVACRVQVRAERGESGQKAGRVSQPHSPAQRKMPDTAFDAEQTVEVSGFFADPAPERQHAMSSDELPDDALEERLSIAVPVGSASGGALWDPLPVTVPTYVTKPRAGRTVRTIDLGEPGTWSSGHVEGEDVELPKRHDEAARDVG